MQYEIWRQHITQVNCVFKRNKHKTINLIAYASAENLMLKLWQFPSCLDIAKILVQ